MNRHKRWKALFLLAGLFLGAGAASCRAEMAEYDEYGPWIVGFAFSFPQETGQTKDVLDHGLGFNLNINYHQPERRLGFRVDVIHASFDLSDSVIHHIQNADGGYASIWGLGGSLLLTTKKPTRLQPQIYGGPGIYYEYAEATRTGIGNGYICDPWFGCYPALAPADYGSVHRSTTRVGYQGGAALSLNFDYGGALTCEVQYVHINNTHADTEFMPINIGYQQRF